jgi:hypothetical protein
VRPRIVALVSSFREGELLASALASVACLDGVLVADGPVGDNRPSGEESVIRQGQASELVRGAWDSDAGKRSSMLEIAKARWQGPLWGLWLDGDELLLWGEYLHDWLARVLVGDDPENPVGGWPLALVELDGSVSICMGKLVRVDLIRRYLVSSSYIEMVNGERRTVGNVCYWTVKDGPLYEHWRARPPLAGEPHLQHRPILRDPGRAVERQHQAEERDFVGVELPATGPVNGST